METENKKRFDLKKFIFQSGLYIFLVFMIIAIMVKEPSAIISLTDDCVKIF